MQIAIDAMGGDRAPEEVVKGALAAARDFKVGVILVGDESAIRKYLPATLPPGIEIQHASQVVDMGEAPTQVRRKKDSSIAVATRLHKEGRAQAVLSAGNTGAAAAAALFILDRIEGVDRPGIATVFPTQRHPLVLVDVGATVDCRPRHLAEFALMGAAYARCVQGIIPGTSSILRQDEIPSVGLLSIGEEASKGNDLTKASYKLLEANAERGHYSFYGNVEGRDIGAGTVDVMVCDGFVGNVVLKVAEGMAKMVSSELRQTLLGDLRAKLGALLLKPALLKFRRRLDYTEWGGAALLGVNGVCIICHGSSDERSIYSAIRISKQLAESDMVGIIRRVVASAGVTETPVEANGNAAAAELVNKESITDREQTGLDKSASKLAPPTVSTESGQQVVPPVSF